jgi:transcriptional regulator with XRE-family HTH domain
MTPTSDRVRLRLREEIARKRLNQRDLGNQLGWSQSRVGKLLTGRTALDVEDLAEMCFVVGISLVEAVRDHGLEFCADMTPTEMRVLERYRQLTDPMKDAVLLILDVKKQTRMESRGRPKK